MGPIFKDLKKSYKGQQIQFVLLDLTDKETSKKAVEIGANLGIKNIYELSASTAVIMLLDANNMNVVNELDLRYTKEEMQYRIDRALKKQSS
jgi:hypothetical protein